jgi:L-lactate utilization protein LutC
MSEEDLDLTHEVKERISAAVTELVNKMTAQLPEHIDELVRTQLTESYRFWR